MNYPRWSWMAMLSLIIFSSCLFREDSSQRSEENPPVLESPDTAGLRTPDLRKKNNPERKKSSDTLRPSVARSHFED